MTSFEDLEEKKKVVVETKRWGVVEFGEKIVRMEGSKIESVQTFGRKVRRYEYYMILDILMKNI